MRDYQIDLGNGYWYDNKPDYFQISDESLEKIEKAYNCRYVTEWNTKSSDGGYNPPRLIFWSDTPHPRGSNWLAFYRHEREWYVADGISVTEVPICCMLSNDKQLLFSKSRHDFRTSFDNSISVDGGRDYMRVLGNIRCGHVWLVPQQGELKIIPETMAKLILQDK